jgi:hypothetical protein
MRGNTFDRSSVEGKFEAIMNQAYKKVLDSAGERIDEGAFRDTYGNDQVDEDIKYVQTRKEQFNRENSIRMNEQARFAMILETIISDQAYANYWLGDNVAVQQASEYDDIKNGVDLIAEVTHDESKSHFALAVDITYAIDLEDKFDRILGEIESGTLGTVKYFESEDGDFHGQLRNVPKVVVGCDKVTMMRVAQLWTSGKQSELAQDPLQLQLLDQIALQLETFGSYARAIGQGAVADKYARQLKLIKNILDTDEKHAVRANMYTKDSDMIVRDEVNRAIGMHCRRIGQLRAQNQH